MEKGKVEERKQNDHMGNKDHLSKQENNHRKKILYIIRITKFQNTSRVFL